MYGKFCTVEDLKRQAITIKLYNNSVWANLGDGRFINRQTKQWMKQFHFNRMLLIYFIKMKYRQQKRRIKGELKESKKEEKKEK